MRKMETLEESQMLFCDQLGSHKDEKKVCMPEAKFLSLVLGGWWPCGHLSWHSRDQQRLLEKKSSS